MAATRVLPKKICTPVCPNYPHCQTKFWLDSPDVVELLREEYLPDLDRVGGPHFGWDLLWDDPATGEITLLEEHEWLS